MAEEGEEVSGNLRTFKAAESVKALPPPTLKEQHDALLAIVEERNKAEADHRAKTIEATVRLEERHKHSQRALWLALTMFAIGMGAGILTTRWAYEGSLLTGVAIGRGEAGNANLKSMEDAQ